MHQKINDMLYGGPKNEKYNKYQGELQSTRKVKNELFDRLKAAKAETDTLREQFNECVWRIPRIS